jgi:hypothetical protein
MEGDVLHYQCIHLEMLAHNSILVGTHHEHDKCCGGFEFNAGFRVFVYIEADQWLIARLHIYTLWYYIEQILKTAAAYSIHSKCCDINRAPRGILNHPLPAVTFNHLAELLASDVRADVHSDLEVLVTHT